MSTATMTRPATRSGSERFGDPVSAAPPRPLVPPLPPRARLTRRGRLVLTALAALILLAVISVGRAGSQAATATETGPSLQQTTVQSGETLWSVAQRIAPQNDPREVVAQLRRINHLHSSGLRVGQQLLLPVAGR
ncbi:MAG: LysM peptidoglycan-binding protein [Frankiales bacterium]|nr:LysM peptidoglycan-binding protein [Frankiales bacterium]